MFPLISWVAAFVVRRVGVILDIQVRIALKLHDVWTERIVRVKRISVHVAVEVDRHIRHGVQRVLF